MSKKTDYLKKLRDGEKLSLTQQIRMILILSVPAIMAQISSIIMQYIDASMVGHLGSEASAAIGLVSSSTWLLGGLCSAVSIGFTVQIAHEIGAGKEEKARNIVKAGLITVLLFSLFLVTCGLIISGRLPHLLGGEDAICRDASRYFLVYTLFIPAMQVNYIAAGMLQCSGNFRLPSILNIIMCFLDVIFNMLLIFPTRKFSILGVYITIPGADLGVTGAALGTALAELLIASIMLFCLLFRSDTLKLRKGEKTVFSRSLYKKALRIAVPVGIEQIIMCGAYIMSTKIVAPLGSISIAANSLCVTAESLCYMPGYGIANAAAAIIGQSIGAKRQDMTKRLGWVSVWLGIAFMTATGALMFVFAPEMIGLLTPDENIRELGTAVLRIEAFAEPMYAASIVASGVFRGAGDTLVPSCLNFFSMWLVRLPVSAFLAPRFGLHGVWIAMCAELCIRGIMFLIRLKYKKFEPR